MGFRLIRLAGSCTALISVLCAMGQDLTRDRNHEGLVDIPHLRLLEIQSAREILDQFEAEAGYPCSGVVLPLTVPEGLTFQNRLGYPTYIASPYGSPIDLERAVRDFATEGVDIYVCLTPTMSFVRTDTLNVVDIVYDEAASFCINKKKAQKVLGIVIEDALQYVTAAMASVSNPKSNFRGIAINVVDLWGMSAENERIMLTCFCPACRESLGKLGIDLKDFETFPNPWNLLLRDRMGGIEHISGVGYGVTRAERVSEIRSQSKLRGFAEQAFGNQSEENLDQLASKALSYMEARQRITLDGLEELFNVARSVVPELRRIVITEGDAYNFTAGLFLKDIDNPELVDELWFDSGASTPPVVNTDYRAYMCSRARYLVDAFFLFAAQVADEQSRASTGVGQFSAQQVMRELKSRKEKIGFANTMTKAELMILEDASNRVGFVGLCLSPQILETILVSVQENLVAIDTENGQEMSERELLQLMQLLGMSEHRSENTDENRMRNEVVIPRLDFSLPSIGE